MLIVETTHGPVVNDGHYRPNFNLFLLMSELLTRQNQLLTPGEFKGFLACERAGRRYCSLWQEFAQQVANANATKKGAIDVLKKLVNKLEAEINNSSCAWRDKVRACYSKINNFLYGISS